MKELERDDPLELVGVGYPAAVALETDMATARCLIEEFALTGFSASDIGSLFGSPSYGLPHAILQRRGEEFVRDLITEVFGGRR
ncbi:MAG: hypothetical protein WD895_08000 [Acidimicrobiia bacterium]